MNELNVLYAFDNNYAPFAGVSMYSLLENNKSIDDIRLFAVLDNVSEENKNKLTSMVNDFGREIYFQDAAELNEKLESMGIPKYRGSYATHYRKFFKLFVPDDVDRLLYLDSDTIVPGNLSGLLDMDFHEKCMGVVLDTLGKKYSKLLGFKEEEPYFNAGIVYIDTKKWAKKDYSKKLVDYITNVRNKFCNPDQDLFNLVLRDDTFVMPLEYNFQPAHRAYSNKAYFKYYPRDNYYSEEEIEYAKAHPMILHAYRFLGEFPWHKNNCHPDNDIFDYYLKTSPWNDYKKKKANKTNVIKIEKALYEILPKNWFLFIFSKALYRSFYKRNKKLEKDFQ